MLSSGNIFLVFEILP
jgi:hypothetical protein